MDGPRPRLRAVATGRTGKEDEEGSRESKSPGESSKKLSTGRKGKVGKEGSVKKPITDPWDERYIYLHENLHENHKNQENVAKYIIHGSYG